MQSLTLRPLVEVHLSADLAALVPHELVALASVRPPWTSYLAYSGAGQAVGACAFKSVPNDRREVEIAYLTFAAFEGQGYGTAMAGLLLDVAAGSGEVDQIIAHTLREENASVKICRRLGFTLVGEVMDPEDGLVWRWKKQATADR